MTGIQFTGVSKQFGGHAALADVSIDIHDGEFIAVLGPSGCGKTTLLRLIAGFERVSAGTIRFGDRVMSSPQHHVAPERRGVGIVFQSYALWPHMNVADNIGYGLRVANVPARERRRRVDEAMDIVGLSGLGERRPADLSGGQRQRVALARCLVTHPTIVLLDEPLANLDVHLRASMQQEFAAFHERTGATMVYVTHDQSEAMGLADRIAVMEEGRITQLATPAELYRKPATKMVASFIGDGFVAPAELNGPALDGSCMARIYGADFRVRCDDRGRQGTAGWVSLHPKNLTLTKGTETGIPARIMRLTYRGGFLRGEVAPEADPTALFPIDLPEGTAPNKGDLVKVAIDDAWVIPSAAS